ncbi:alpha/beta hydrolase [Martelella alba]|uniref:Alpha/beta hydrolase n=1 Tax=Martelella alba TaxID=2590451 RepID=A0ABY2SR93_9HYPH|nr:alpha/beta fold hydrolase [Martelella alba]TKI08261.1 alpha/beta hydrolase [Martelella alba]
MRETILQTRAIKMRFLDAGKGPLILFCHGFPETAHAWRHQIEALAQAGYRAVAPDMRGYGKTDGPEVEFSRDVRLTLRKLIFAASGEAGPRKLGDGTPNPSSVARIFFPARAIGSNRSGQGG